MPKPSSRLAAFNSDSDSDDEPKSSKKVFTGMNAAQKRLVCHRPTSVWSILFKIMSHFQAEKAQEKALEEDPTIFQYDELYDDMAAKKDEVARAKKPDGRESKYIAKLLVTADKRKKEYERRIERQVQKERDAEGDEFADKEVFVTAAYRAKLEEMKKAEEEERREEYLESIGDVTKQKDLDGFYRHLYEQKVGPEKKAAVAVDDETEKNKSEQPAKKKRTYRRRKSNENDADDNEDDAAENAAKKAHLQSNLDADSDFSIDSSSDDEEKEDKKSPVDAKEKAAADPEKDAVEPTASVPEHDFAKPNPVDDKDDVKSSSSDEEPEHEVKEVKVKIDVWKKRTVGDVFDAALQRYYERKQMREG